MVRVKRPVIKDTPLELPAGSIDKDENVAAGAARELLEETGIQVTSLDEFKAMPRLQLHNS